MKMHSPGISSLQDALSLVSYDFLSQIIQHPHSQQHPEEQ